MDGEPIESPRDFLRNSDFTPDRAHTRFPNAQRHTVGGLFVSHAGKDTAEIRDTIVLPVVFDRLPADGYFMHSKGSGGADGYRQLVQAALYWCDKFMVVISKESIRNKWVYAEVEWAFEHSRPVLVARLDKSDWSDLAIEIGIPERVVSRIPVFDFSADVRLAQRGLAAALDELLKRLPRRKT